MFPDNISSKTANGDGKLSNEAKPLIVFAGRVSDDLGAEISANLGIEQGSLTVRNFSDGEISVGYDESIRGSDIFIVQSTPPPGDNLMELLMLIDAAERASAKHITAVIPYFGYARQDRKDKPRVAIAAKLVANMLVKAGADRVLTMDLHAPQIQGFFDVPVDHLYGSALFMNYIKDQGIDNLVVVAPDVGASKRARAYASRLECDMALIDKRRPKANVTEVMNVIGDVEGKNVLLVDDLIDTAGTLVGAAAALKNEGAKRIMAACTHPLLSGPAYERIADSEIETLLVTNTIPLERNLDKIKVLSVARYFADAIRRIHIDASVSQLFVE